MKLLVVEDQPKVAGFLKKGLEEEGWQVVVASGGEQALRLRPILMTTLATIFGFLPLAMGEVSEMLQLPSISMMGVMSLSMLFSLLVIPGFYWVLNGGSSEWKRASKFKK
ncbi:MAG TPA: hypothetical protein ENK14_10240 [Caldithrix sp.]|nr:hypothetical protein [Caldithrix sp.]